MTWKALPVATQIQGSSFDHLNTLAQLLRQRGANFGGGLVYGGYILS